MGCTYTRAKLAKEREDWKSSAKAEQPRYRTEFECFCVWWWWRVKEYYLLEFFVICYLILINITNRWALIKYEMHLRFNMNSYVSYYHCQNYFTHFYWYIIRLAKFQISSICTIDKHHRIVNESNFCIILNKYFKRFISA